jgi:uncharacterized DUF497 family protein
MGRTVISEDRRFEWDEEKAEFNLKKHGLGFEEILSVFDDPCLLEFYDDSHSTGTEDRMRGIGSLQGCYMHVIRNGADGQEFFPSEKPVHERRIYTMNGSKPLTTERIAEIKAFKDADISDCPELTEEELKKMRPRNPEYFKPMKKAV